MDLSQITPVVLTYNEQPNIERSLSRLSWAREVFVIDSNSTDQTQELAKRFANVRFIQRSFDTHANQWNFGLQQVNSKWVLSLDADYLLGEDFVEELRELPENEPCIYSARLRFCINGKALRSSILPPREVLFPVALAAYIDDGHTQRLQYSAPLCLLSSEILHDDRKSLQRWYRNQLAYMNKESVKLADLKWSHLRTANKIRRLILPAAPLVFIYTYLIKFGFLDGLEGLKYAAQRSFAELLLSVFLVKRYLHK